MKAAVEIEIPAPSDLVERFRKAFAAADVALAAINERPVPRTGAGALHAIPAFNAAIDAMVETARSKLIAAMKGWKPSGDTEMQIRGSIDDPVAFWFRVRFEREA